jgi:hypothetical protein
LAVGAHCGVALYFEHRTVGGAGWRRFSRFCGGCFRSYSYPSRACQFPACHGLPVGWILSPLRGLPCIASSTLSGAMGLPHRLLLDGVIFCWTKGFAGVLAWVNAAIVNSTDAIGSTRNPPCFTESKASFQILAMQELYVAKASLRIVDVISP